MTFDPSTPQANQRISDSQPIIQTNFAQTNTVFGVDHITFTAASNRGWHNQSTYPEQAVVPAAGADRGEVYTKDKAGITELYYRYDNSATPAGREIQLSAIKAWCRFDGTLPSPIAITDGSNVANVTKTAIGNYQINFTRPLGNATYAVTAMCALSPGHAHPMVPQTLATTVNNCSILTRKSDNVTLDSPDISVIIVGN
jgi:hypothetical protein